MSRPRLIVTLLASFIALAPTALTAQAVSVSAACSEGWSTLGALGIAEFNCDCTFDSGAHPAWRFRGEPVVRAVSSNGPASGRLKAGDVLLAIDGMLITTRAAGARLANLRPGQPLILTVRRANREIEVRIVPDEPCEPPVPPPAAPVATARDVPTPRPPRASTPAPPPPAPSAWFGFGISCRNCETNVTNHSEIERAEEELRALINRADRVSQSQEVLAARARIRNLRRENTSWRFSEYPSLFSVDPGSPAYEAGLRRGDVLMKIDGISLLTVEGAGRFGQVEPGQIVAFTYRRGGSERSVRVRAIERPSGSDIASAEGVTEAMADLERIQTQRARELEEQAVRLHESLDHAADVAGTELRQRELTELRADLDRLNSTHSVESQAQLNKLRSELALIEETRAVALASSSEDQHLRFTGSVGNTEVEVRGLSSVEVSYDNSTGELLIRTIDSTIRVKAPVHQR